MSFSFSRPRRASFSSKESAKGDSVCQQLTKKLQNLKKKIKQFEEQFEKDKNYMVGTSTYNTTTIFPNPYVIHVYSTYVFYITMDKIPFQKYFMSIDFIMFT